MGLITICRFFKQLDEGLIGKNLMPNAYLQPDGCDKIVFTRNYWVSIISTLI
jgi:hypothetical protein